MQLGKAVAGFGKIPGGSDQYSLWHVFQAGAKPVWITAGGWWGGDTNETAVLYLAPPGPPLSNGTQDPSDYGGDERNAIPITASGALTGGDFTNQNKGTMFNGRNVPSIGFYVPANWNVVAWQDTANTATWKFQLQGFEIDDASQR